MEKLLFPEETQPEAVGDGRTVAAEANFLRFPLFALTTKGLRTLDGIQCRGQIERDGELHSYTLTASRNVQTLYPGPLARAAHLAFLSLITEAGLPFDNPVRWTWRDLFRRIGIVSSGRTLSHVKGAILSTKGLMIRSEYALYSKRDRKPICTREAALGLYDRVVFQKERLPDGGMAETNMLWLSPWYLDNLNAFFTAPLDYDLWRRLDQKSSVASRLYEFLLLNFFSGTPLLRFNYPNLAQMLPLRQAGRLSKAREQLDPAFALLQGEGLVRNVEWDRHPQAVAKIRIYPGALLPAPAGQPAPEPTMEVTELRNVKPPEWQIVVDFYKQWSGEEFARPTAKELGQARELIETHGATKAKALVPVIVKKLKAKWPDAKSFGAAVKYVPDALNDYERMERDAVNRHAADVRNRREKEENSRQAKETEELQRRWESLSESQRHEIKQRVIQKQPWLHQHSGILERICLLELKERPQT